MRTTPEIRKERGRKAVLDELERLGEERHPRNQTVLARFARCQDLQRTALTFARAVDAGRRIHSATALAPPVGGWFLSERLHACQRGSATDQPPGRLPGPVAEPQRQPGSLPG